MAGSNGLREGKMSFAQWNPHTLTSTLGSSCRSCHESEDFPGPLERSTICKYDVHMHSQQQTVGSAGIGSSDEEAAEKGVTEVSKRVVSHVRVVEGIRDRSRYDDKVEHVREHLNLVEAGL